MKQPTLQEWFEIVCDDLDPDRSYIRPTFLIKTEYGNNSYCIDINEVWIDPAACHSQLISSKFALAHELRHWFQVMAGRLRVGFYYFSWDNKDCTEKWLAVTSREDYRRLPWEADANQYADEVCARLLSQTKAS